MPLCDARYLTTDFRRRYPEAKAAYERVIKLEPRHASALGFLGMVYHLMWNLDAAIIKYHEVRFPPSSRVESHSSCTGPEHRPNKRPDPGTPGTRIGLSRAGSRPIRDPTYASGRRGGMGASDAGTSETRGCDSERAQRRRDGHVKSGTTVSFVSLPWVVIRRGVMYGSWRKREKRYTGACMCGDAKWYGYTDAGCRYTVTQGGEITSAAVFRQRLMVALYVQENLSQDRKGKVNA